MAIIFGAWWDVASGTYAIVHTTYIQISYSSVKVGMLTVGIKISINTLHIAHRIYIELMRAILSKVTTLYCEYRITIQSPNTELQYRKHIYPTSGTNALLVQRQLGVQNSYFYDGETLV